MYDQRLSSLVNRQNSCLWNTALTLQNVIQCVFDIMYNDAIIQDHQNTSHWPSERLILFHLICYTWIDDHSTWIKLTIGDFEIPSLWTKKQVGAVGSNRKRNYRISH